MGFEEDYFWTGGGFSDWSGNSMGKFSWNSRGASGAGGGPSYSSKPDGENSEKDKMKETVAKLKAQLAKEKEHGLPQKANDMPEFISLGSWYLRMGLMLLSIVMQVVAMLMYICYPNQLLTILPTIIFFLSEVGLSTMTVLSANWYVVKRGITQGMIKKTMALQKVIVLAVSILSLLIAFTPIWCCMLSRLIFNHKELFLFRSIYETEELSYGLFSDALGWIIVVTTIFATYFAFCVTLGTVLSYGESRGTAAERLTYTHYCQENGLATPQKIWSARFLYSVLGAAFFLSCIFAPKMWTIKRDRENAIADYLLQEQRWNDSHKSVSSDGIYDYQRSDNQDDYIPVPTEINETTTKVPKPATTPARHHSTSGRSYGSSYSYGSSSRSSSYDDEWDDDDDDDTWYMDEDDADEQYEYDYWE